MDASANANNNLVAPEDACPNCGERDADRLVWVDETIVRCSACGAEYDPLDRAKGGGDAL